MYLHSLTALEEAAGRLADDDGIGLLGAVGVTRDGTFVGRVRDSIVLACGPAREPTAVESVDELLFLVPRRMLEREPLTEDSELAWHAYAVEYGLRVRGRGGRVCIVDIPVTHNSLGVNLNQLEVAYAAVAAKHPASMPVFTPQGKVPRGRKQTGGLSGHRWRYRWLLDSIRAQQGRRAKGAAPWILADVRLDIDDVLARLRRRATARVQRGRPRRLHRRATRAAGAHARRPAHTVHVRHARGGPCGDRGGGDGPVLLTNLGLDDVRALAGRLAARRPVMGLWTSLGYGRCSGRRGRRCRRPGGCAGRRRSAVRALSVLGPRGYVRRSRRSAPAVDER